MAKQGWSHFFLYKASVHAHLQMTSKDICSAIVWLGKQTDVHKAAVVVRDKCRGESVTHMAVDLITFVEKTLLMPERFHAEETLWIYRDVAGHWDRILPTRNKNRIMVTFAPVGDRTAEAASMAIATHGFDITNDPLRELLQEMPQ